MQKTKRNNRKQNTRRKRMNGGNSSFIVPIRSFYPQNTLEVDPQRSMIQTGGTRKKYSRKYLKPVIKGGSGFFSNFGTFRGPIDMLKSGTTNNFSSSNFMV